ncbi:sensor histidine kinase [Alteromonas sp. ASW11-130]|uniref:sensor histidine kinase n=1 Tax=Alteromonas sp. ASW11-130 TaxID=3015775 RepID=UPI002242790B|nr:sensor histidine kinase [Alteromonas sp. ASW11-130]MCW8092605.1 sensor histidine kinase [Alteromonas sp. ASW11-130]
MSDSDTDTLIAEIQRQQGVLKARLDDEQNALTELAKRLWAQQESDKARLSRELHDGVGQLLTGLTRRLQTMASTDPAVSELADIAELALSDVRQLSRLMSPTILDDLGLKPALNWLCRNLFEHEQINYTCEVDVNADLPKDISILIFRVTQESLVNSIKHAYSSDVKITVRQHFNMVKLSLIDNGKGFTRDKITPGVGLASIEDRAKAFNAELTINSSPENGTRISLTIPL